MIRFSDFVRKNLFGILLTIFLLISLVIISFSVSNVRQPSSKAATVGCEAGQASTILRPNANGLTGYWSWVPTSGTAYDKVDEAGEGDGNSTYIWDDSVNLSGVRFLHPPISLGSDREIASAIINVRARQGSGNQAFIQPAVFVNGNFYYGTKSQVVSTYTLYQYVLSVNPATRQQWAVNDINASQIGAGSSRYNQGNAILVTQIWLEVCSKQKTQPPPPPPPPPINPGGGSKPKPQSTNTLKKVNLKVLVPFLLGEIKAKVGIEQFSADLTLKKDQTDYQIDLSSSSLALNKIYTLTFSADKILKKKVQFNATSAETTVNATELALGDLNADSAINNQDQLMFLDSISKQTLVGDINGDGVTNSIDWSILIYNIGKTGD